MRAAWLARLVVFPVVGGVYVQWRFTAPPHYALTNLGAFLIGFALIRFGRLPRSLTGRRLLAAALLGIFALPLATGPDLDGVSRWLELGPVRLNAGLLTVPLLAVLCVRDAECGWPVLTVALLVGLLQPDASAVLATALSLLAWSWVHSNWRPLIVGLVGLGATGWAHAHGILPPVDFVESLVPMLWHDLDRPFQAGAVAVLLAIPLLYFAAEKDLLRQDATMLVATYTGFLAMSFAGAYPVPLAGYGAASIIGFMAAIAATPRNDERVAADRLVALDIASREQRLWRTLRGE